MPLLSSSYLFSHAVPAVEQTAAVWILALTALVLGKPLTRGQGPDGLSLIPGLAVLVVPSLLANMYFELPLYVFPSICLIGAVIVVLANKPLLPTIFQENATFLYALLLMTPLMALLSLAIITGWDDMSHWTPNVDYLVRYHALPRADGPATASAWPGYPYAYPFLGYLISLLVPPYAANALPLVNVMLLCLGASMAAHFATGKRGALAAIAGVLLVIPLYPGFHRSTTFVAMADYPTAVWLAGLTVLLFFFVQRRISVRECIGLGLAFAAFVAFKQANLVLVLIQMGALILFWLFFRSRLTLKKLGQALLVGAAALVMHVLWSHYVGEHIAGKEFAFLPFSEWRFAYIPDIVNGMWDHAIAKHGHYYLMTLAVAGLGVGALLRRKPDALNLLILTAACLVGVYFAFLFFIYIANSYTLGEAKRAASFWRYSLHVGLIAWIAFVAVAHKLVALRFPRARWPRFRNSVLVMLFVFVAALPIALNGQFIREQSLGERLFFRNLASQLPDNSTVAFADAYPGSPMSWVLSLELRSPTHPVIKGTVVRSCFANGLPKTIDEGLAAAVACNATHAVIRIEWENQDNDPVRGFKAFARSADGSWSPIAPVLERL